jgi:hypothetical protein
MMLVAYVLLATWYLYLAGISSNIQRLRVAFDEDRVPNLYEDKLVLQVLVDLQFVLGIGL